jgi:hypothetical protein
MSVNSLSQAKFALTANKVGSVSIPRREPIPSTPARSVFPVVGLLANRYRHFRLLAVIGR